jgi:hypothetical protein
MRAMLRRTAFANCLRMVFMAMLLLGLCLQPVFAAACDVEDVRVAFDHEGGPGPDTDTDGGAAECCANPACSDGCLHAAASLPTEQAKLAVSPSRTGTAPVWLDFTSSDQPVNHRPPIRV